MKHRCYKSFFDQASQALACHRILVDDDGQPFDYEFIDVNPAYERMTGFEASRLIGKTCRDIHPEISPEILKRIQLYGHVALYGDKQTVEIISDDGLQRFHVEVTSPEKGVFLLTYMDVDSKTEPNLMPGQPQHRLQNKEGSYKVLEWQGYARGKTVYALAQDITGRLTINGRLRESDEKFRLFFNNAPLGLLYFDKDAVITECNDSFVKIIGSSRERLVGLNMMHLPNERLKKAFRASLDDHVTTHLEMEYESYTAQKKTPVRLIIVPIVSDQGTGIAGIAIVEDITERVSTQKALEASKESYQTLFEQAADGVLIGVHGGMIRDANQNMTLISGYEKNELVGANITMLFSESTLKEIPLNYQALQDGKIVCSTRELSRKDGGHVTVEMKTKKLGDGRLFSSMRDVTPLKKAEAALKASEDRLKRFFDLNPYSILITDAAGCPLHINQAFYNLFGSGPVPGVSIFETPVISKLGIGEEIKKVLAGETIRIPDFCFTAQGMGRGKHQRSLWLRMVIFPLMDLNGDVEMLIMMYEDVTEHYMLKEKLKHAEKMEAIGVLTGGIAHDFNNMLSGIIGGATILSNYEISDDARRSLKLITDSAGRMANLTGKLLTFGRKDGPNLKQIDIHSVIRSAIDILSYSIDKKIDMACEFEGAALIVKGSDSELQNVFINLGINASHAMPRGGILTFRTSVVKDHDIYPDALSGESDEKRYVKIEVIDTGTGIPAEYQNKIFEPFFTTKKMDQGAGLGLATVYGTIKEHQGMIDFISEPNQGSTFFIYIPYVGDHLDQTVHTQDSIEKGSGRVLLVEDEAIVRDATQDMLEALGYTVITAENGQEGFDRFSSEKESIDLVILDMMMPKMNGKDCFKKIKSIKPTARIILYSGYTDMGDVAELEKDGLCAFMKKPFSFAELSRVLKSCGC